MKLKIPDVVSPPPPPPPPPPKPGVRVAEADLRPNEIQDLADVIGELTAAAVGYELKFHLRIELGSKTSPPQTIADQINQILQQVSREMHLK